MLAKASFCPYSASMATPPDLEDLARRYLDLWQEQLRAMSADPETLASMGRMLSAMGGADAPAPVNPPTNPMAWMSAFGVVPPGAATGGANPFDAVFATGREKPEAGPAPAAAASDGGGDDLRQLERRLAALEERITALESGSGKPKRRSAKGARKGKP
jgi:hypothetical protein